MSTPQSGHAVGDDDLPAGQILLAPDLSILGIDETYARLLHREPHTLIGRPLLAIARERLFPVRPVEALQASLSAVLALRRPDAFRPMDLEVPPAMAAWRVVNTPLIAANGEITSIVHRLERGSDRGSLAGPRRPPPTAELIGRLAHDFNNLLGIVIGNLDVLNDLGTGGEGVAQLVGEALDAALRGTDLTGRLLAAAGRQALRPAPVAPAVFLAELARSWRSALGPDIGVAVDVAADAWTIAADPGHLTACLGNLVDNARAAMPDGGLLTVTAGNRDAVVEAAPVSPGDYGVIELRDSGTGIPPSLLPRVCEPFVTTKQGLGCTGLGLSVVAGFARQSGGHLELESELGAGTIVRLLLPRA
jgi:signal transduction histidine kinase